MLSPSYVGMDSKESSSQSRLRHLGCKQSSLSHPSLAACHTPFCRPLRRRGFLEEAELCLPITSAPLGEHICFHFRALFHLLLVSVKRGFLENRSSKCAAYVFLITNNIFLFSLTGMFSLSPVVLSLYRLVIK